MCLLAPLHGSANSPVSSKQCRCSGSGDVLGCRLCRRAGLHPWGHQRWGQLPGDSYWAWGSGGGFFRVCPGKRGVPHSSVVSPAYEQIGQEVAKDGIEHGL